MKPESSILDAMPANVDAEKTILGAVLLDVSAWSQVQQMLKPGDFSLDSHRRIAIAMKILVERDSSVDIVTLQEYLAHRKEASGVLWLAECGGTSYLASLTEGLPRRPAIADYLKIVKDKSLGRQAMSACDAAIHELGEQAESALWNIGTLQKQLDQIVTGSESSDASHVSSFIETVMQEVQEDYSAKATRCIPSGVPWLDDKMGGGFKMAKYTIVAARPKNGKSGLGQSAIAYNCKRGQKCVLFTPEMDKSEVMKNLVPHFTPSLTNRVCHRPDLRTPDQHNLLLRTLEEISDTWLLHIEDGEQDMDKICWSMDRETRKDESVLFVIDHFGLVGGSSDIRKRYVENSTQLRKKIKQKRNCAALALFQLNPVPREYADKRPQPEDLKESKNPLEDAFATILLHRYIDKDTLKFTKQANINVALIRGGGGEPGNVDCEFDTRTLSFLADAKLEFENNSYYVD